MSKRDDPTVFGLLFLPLLIAGAALSASVLGLVDIVDAIVNGPKVPSTYKAAGPAANPFLALAVASMPLAIQAVPWAYYRYYKTLVGREPDKRFFNGSLTLKGVFVLGCAMYAAGALGLLVVCSM